MHIILVPGKDGRTGNACLTHRQVLLLGVIFLLVLPVSLGMLVYKLGSALDRQNRAQLDPEYLAQLERTVAGQKQQIDETKKNAEAHLNALAMRIGHLQAQVMRINALGQRLTSMAGLDKGEFNFSEEPPMGGPEQRMSREGAGTPDFVKSLDRLSSDVERKTLQIGLLEGMMVDRQLRAQLNPVGWPVVGGFVTSTFGARADPFTGRHAFHEGVDIANKMGAPIKAMAAGVVTYVGERPGYGLTVEVNHGNDYATRYAHVLASLVKVGDKIEKGQGLATVGASGRATGPHLHFEVLRDGNQINPRSFLRTSS